eukprot:CAMPEP_0179165926 /NCGR_PEP_ID=MMETSP0796-20121207/81504_1 /TAXON_ID=73915 /ORGANISM="Pyrodinium bahamense, Strain pbaha01" /LENGTH=145 /DNA_ID=CAMNT_0020868497 /DNA_START=788 /DNA_END=1226 /DNA_ORIENTATION=+
MGAYLSEMASPRTVLMWPVSESFSVPLARSQILISRSFPEDANHSFVGSTATQRTQPSWPESTRISFQGGCHVGLGTSGRARGGIICTAEAAASCGAVVARAPMPSGGGAKDQTTAAAAHAGRVEELRDGRRERLAGSVVARRAG